MSVTGIQLKLPIATLVVICCASLALASCGGGGATRKRDADGRVVPTLAEQDPSGTLYAKSIGDAARGECDDQTLNVLTCFAYRGHGYEGAQTALGQCRIAMGEKREGVEWVQRAADSGWPDAQKLLSQLYLAGEAMDRDVVEAAKWAKLYSRNPSLLSLGVQPDMSVLDGVRSNITPEQAAQADQRVTAWIPRYWSPATQVDREVKRSCDVEGRRPQPRPEVPTVPNVF